MFKIDVRINFKHEAKQGVSRGGRIPTFASDSVIIELAKMVTLSLLAEKTFCSGKFFLGLYDGFLDLQIVFTLIFYKMLLLL